MASASVWPLLWRSSLPPRHTPTRTDLSTVLPKAFAGRPSSGTLASCPGSSRPHLCGVPAPASRPAVTQAWSPPSVVWTVDRLSR